MGRNSGATAYKVDIGSSPIENDILNGGVFYTNSTFVLNFEPNSLYFIRIVPFNSTGEAIDCNQTSFSTILGCGPNSDGFHDYWQYLYGSNHDFIIEVLYIYDRYGKLVKQINPYGKG
jgi:hypothetical protein